MSCLGILDWGIGGMGLVGKMRQRCPGVPILYVSDSGAPPYGTLPHALLQRRIRSVIEAMQAHGADVVAVACNAASTALPADMPGVHSLIPHGVAAVQQAGVSRVGVIGGARTIRSRAYRRALEAIGVEVHQRIAQPLSAHVEQGTLSGPRLEADLARILRPLRTLPALLLGCTHYPALAAPVQRMLGEHTLLIDPVDHMVMELKTKLSPEEGLD